MGLIANAAARSLSIEVPTWVDEVVAAFRAPLDSDRACLSLAVELARENVERGGGPFGAAVFAGDRLLSAGVNLVLSSRFSIAHAEIVALMRGQAALGESALNPPALSLFTSAEPCCQCFGSLIWAGVTRLVCGATTADVEEVGFDEGPKPEGWVKVLEARGIQVSQGVERAASRAVLVDYVARGGQIYGKLSASE